MSVDMHVHRVLQEIEALPRFERDTFRRDRRVWAAGFPAWRALFSSHCLYGHCIGYKLPGYEKFFELCRRAYLHRNHRDSYTRYFQGDLLQGMRHRVAVWYESGMAETHLYASLVDAFEDERKSGLVVYDPRVDWKLKTDMIVITRGQPTLISAFYGNLDNRPSLEKVREETEHERKRNTADSAHWGNVELASMRKCQIGLSADNHQEVNGIRLFSPTAIEQLITQVTSH